jgi:K(+)-stimulated pyrophosphate-energized sodium pump
MRIATKANVRTTQAAKTSLAKALKVSFGGGTVMGSWCSRFGRIRLKLFLHHFLSSSLWVVILQPVVATMA